MAIRSKSLGTMLVGSKQNYMMNYGYGDSLENSVHPSSRKDKRVHDAGLHSLPVVANHIGCLKP